MAEMDVLPKPEVILTHESDLDGLVAGVLLQRRVEGAEIAEAVAYLAKARNVTGQLIAVDSGQHLGWRTPDIID